MPLLSMERKTISEKRLLHFAEECGISKASAEKMIAKIVSMKPKYIDMCSSSLLPDYLKERFVQLIEQRCRVLEDAAERSRM